MRREASDRSLGVFKTTTSVLVPRHGTYRDRSGIHRANRLLRSNDSFNDTEADKSDDKA